MAKSRPQIVRDESWDRFCERAEAAKKRFSVEQNDLRQRKEEAFEADINEYIASIKGDPIKFLARRMRELNELAERIADYTSFLHVVAAMVMKRREVADAAREVEEARDELESGNPNKPPTN